MIRVSPVPIVVSPSGPEDARIVVLGEAPGEQEIAAIPPCPFVGPAGRLLFDSILARARIRRSECLTLNVHWEMPPRKKWETAPNLGAYDQATMNAICVQPRSVIIAIGGHALDFCRRGSANVKKEDRLEITKWRGSILDESYFATSLRESASTWEPSPVVVPMIHPAAVLRSGGYGEDGDEADEEGTSKRSGLHYQALCIHDAKRVRGIVDGTIGRNPKRDVWHAGNCGYDELRHRLHLLTQHAPIAFDIETFAHTVTCIGLADSPTHAVVVPLTEIPTWTRAQQSQAVEAVAAILDGPTPKIGQHLDYDVQHLARMGIPVRNVWLDCAVAHSILYPEIPHDLGTLVSLYTLQPYFKDMREESKESGTDQYTSQHWEYCGLDCCATHEVGMKLAKELETTMEKRR